MYMYVFICVKLILWFNGSLLLNLLKMCIGLYGKCFLLVNYFFGDFVFVMLNFFNVLEESDINYFY